MEIQEKPISRLESFFLIISIILFSGAVFPMLQAAAGPVGGGGRAAATSDDAPADAGEGNITMQVVFIAVYVITLVLIIAKSKNLKSVFRNDLSMNVLFLLVIASVAWSEVPLITLRRIGGILGTSLFAYYLSSRFSLKTTLQLMLTSCCIMAALSLVAGVVYSKFAIMTGVHQGRWRGVFAHKNNLGGIMCLYSVIAFSWASITKKNLYLYMHLLLAVALIILSRSAGSLVTVFLLLIFGYLLKVIKIPYQALFSILSFLIIIALTSGIYLYGNYSTILKTLGRDATLTGRTVLWVELLKWVDRRPFLGYGYGGFWTGDSGFSAIVDRNVGWSPPHAHNGFLNLVLQVGFVGLILFLICYLSNFWKYLMNCMVKQQSVYSWGILFFSLLLVYNMDESTILRANQIYWVLFIFTITCYRKIEEQTKTKYVLVPI